MINVLSKKTEVRKNNQMESRELKNIITEKKKNWNEGRVQYKNREMIEEEARALEY